MISALQYPPRTCLGEALEVSCSTVALSSRGKISLLRMKTLVLRFQHHWIYHSVIQSEVQILHSTQNKAGRGSHLLRNSPTPSHSEYCSNDLILFSLQRTPFRMLLLWCLSWARLSQKCVRDFKVFFFLPGSLLNLGTTQGVGMWNGDTITTK